MIASLKQLEEPLRGSVLPLSSYARPNRSCDQYVQAREKYSTSRRILTLITVEKALPSARPSGASVRLTHLMLLTMVFGAPWHSDWCPEKGKEIEDDYGPAWRG